MNTVENQTSTTE